MYGPLPVSSDQANFASDAWVDGGSTSFIAKRSDPWAATGAARAQLSAKVRTSGFAPFTFGATNIASVKFGHGVNATSVAVGLCSVTT